MEGPLVKRFLVAAIGTIGCASALVGCSSNGQAAGPASGVSVGSGTQATVQVAGTNLAGLDPSTVTCTRQGGKITIGSGTTTTAAAAKQALAVVMTDAAPPTVDSLVMYVDGNALSVTNTMGAKAGSANVKVDGKTYTITGQAQGADMKNPMAGMVTKDFNIKVTCG
jgi:lipoprotein LpqH